MNMVRGLAARALSVEPQSHRSLRAWQLAFARMLQWGRSCTDSLLFGHYTSILTQPYQNNHIAYMDSYRNHYDVTNQVDTTDPVAVNAEVNRIFLELYWPEYTARIDRAFRDVALLYSGKYPGYHACDTAYHDIQHVLDMTLAMARLMHGFERARIVTASLQARLFNLGIVTALFHDAGYVRRLDDTEHANGGELTLIRVSRGAEFLRSYLPQIGMGDLAEIAADLIHFTGYEIPVARIEVPSLRYKLLGSFLGTADIIAQMSDRCYLEKCRDRLYPEFLAGGIARKRLPEGGEQVVFESGDDLVMKTPQFYRTAMGRLDGDLGSSYRYAETHFGGSNLYLDEIGKNVRFAQAIDGQGNTSALRRTPPETLARA